MLPTLRSPGTTSPRTDRPCPCLRPARRSAVTAPLSAVAGGILLLCAPTLQAQELGGQWYVGAGAGGALLRPDSEAAGFDTDEEPTTSGTVFIGRDLDTRSSVQLQLHALGETTLERDESATGEGEPVTYTGVDASVLYRFFDSRDRAPRGTVFGVSLYGRFGLGYLQRDTDVPLENDADVNFGAGAGVELYLTRSLALRAEGIFHDRDAGSGSLSLVARFGGPAARQQRPPAPPTPSRPTAPTAPASPTVPAAPTAPAAPTVPAVPSVPEAPAAPTRPAVPTLPAVPDVAAPSATPRPDATNLPLPNTSPDAPLPDPNSLPETLDLRTVDPALLPERPNAARVPTAPTAPTVPGDSGVPVDFGPAESTGGTGGGTVDRDGDGVADTDDTCPRSAPGYPVRDNGCALLDGVLSSLRFTPGTADLAPGASDQLDYLAGLLNDYPDARIELIAHTDDAGDERGQSILGRARLRTLGTYLVRQGGVRANRLLLRSFGGTRPLYDNGTVEGRAANNRIEILERTAAGQ